MKVLSVLISSLLFCCLIANSQTAAKMYKQWPDRDTAYKGKTYTTPKSAYPDSTDTTKVIGFAIAPLYKKLPESPLGNFMADCMKLYAGKVFAANVDAAFVNYSSMRSYIAKGDITTGAIFRLMPYDNQIVLLTLQGSVLKAFLDHVAAIGGWPCAGITMRIKNGAAADVLIGQKPLDEEAPYTIAVADYIANGGNQCTMLKGLPQVKKNYLFRDALIEYVADFTKGGKPVTAAIENRVVRSNE